MEAASAATLANWTEDPTSPLAANLSPFGPTTAWLFGGNHSASSPGHQPTAIESRGVATTVGIALTLYGITLFTVLGNALVLLSVFNFRHLRSVKTNWFIASLAFSDFLVALLVMSLAATNVVFGYWPFGPVICQIHAALDILLSTASIFNLCVISLERYWAVMRPFEYTSKMNRRTAVGMIAAVWVFAALVSAIQLTTNILVLPHESAAAAAGQLPQCVFHLNAVYAVLSSTISFYIPSIIMIAVYQKIFRTARKIEKHIYSQDRAVSRISSRKIREQKATRTLGIIMGVFITCWTPFFVINCLFHWDGVGIDDVSFLVVTWLGWINSALNPVIYATNRDFRRTFRRLMCGHCAAAHERKCMDYYDSYYTGPEVTSPRVKGHRVTTTNSCKANNARAPPLGNSRVHYSLDRSRNNGGHEFAGAPYNGHRRDGEEPVAGDEDEEEFNSLREWTPTSEAATSPDTEKTSPDRPGPDLLLHLDFIRRESTV